jgi:diguanylate cyclase (GGDEF)-like protein
MAKILVIDDSAEIHTIIKIRLEKDGHEVVFAREGAEGIAIAQDILPDVILLDVDMPGLSGFEVCTRLKAAPSAQHVPILFLTANASIEDKVRGLELGAVDYITKPFDPVELKARVKASVRMRELVTMLERMAQVDALTGLGNRAYFEHHLAVELAAASRSEAPLSCVMADVDHFKSINDTYGHGVGDDVLRIVGGVFRQVCREEDIACRYGGEEFVLILRNTTELRAKGLAERLRQVIQSQSITRPTGNVVLTCSFGVAQWRRGDDRSVVELADQALYAAKHQGRNRVESIGA